MTEPTVDALEAETTLARQAVSKAPETPMTPVIARMVAEVSSDLTRLEAELDEALARRVAANEEVKVLRRQIEDSIRVLRNLTPKPPKPRTPTSK
jgi:hypothetical protein